MSSDTPYEKCVCILESYKSFKKAKRRKALDASVDKHAWIKLANDDIQKGKVILRALRLNSLRNRRKCGISVGYYQRKCFEKNLYDKTNYYSHERILMT